ncbi:MAG: UDP-N-acetylmuramoyl-tripeptide--D-alanyl-D-alanine ligase [Candidatus Kapaibacterium sp.]
MRIATVRDLLGIISHLRFTGRGSVARRAIRGFSTDSRSLKKGEAFIALRGENFDGHRFLDAVAARGASVAIVAAEWLESNGAITSPLPLVVVDDPLATYGEIATAHRAGFGYPVIAVAGSNGKTTTKELIAALLGTKYQVLKTEGNLNNLIGVPAMMLRMTKEQTAAVIEIGTNMPGEIEKLCAILRPTHGIITNIGREHLELLGSVEGVAREEGSLFEYLSASGGTAFVNLDDRHIAGMGRKLPKRVTYGARGEIAVRRGGLDRSGAPAIEIIDRRKEKHRSIAVQLRTPGSHTAVNALAASAVAVALRVPLRDIKRTLENFEPPVYGGGYARLATMSAANGARVLNDTYNANPDSTLAALATLAAMKPGRKGRRIVVLADMRELGESSAEEHERIGLEIVRMGRKIDLALFHGDEMLRAHRAIGTAGTGATASSFYELKEDLAGALVAMVTPEDIVLVKGSRGMRMEDVVRALTAADDHHDAGL